MINLHHSIYNNIHVIISITVYKPNPKLIRSPQVQTRIVVPHNKNEDPLPHECP
jgi:hypothetical protein